jgi:seryl-tRNA synthetase
MDQWDVHTDRVVENVEKILLLLSKTDNEATFFVLEEVARNHPGLVKRIHEEGHEIGSHGYSHQLLSKLSRSELEIEIEQLETDREERADELEQVESRIAEADQLEAQRDELQAEIEQLRTRIEDLEREAVDQFNEHMDTVLQVLEYENVDRIWLERTERESREGRQTVTKRHFEPHLVRSTDDGAVYEDTVDHLSESEREVTGLVFGLAGYLTHELHEKLPFMLLDSVEAIDSQRIAELVAYFGDYPEYLVGALLEEDAAALDDTYHRVSDI